MNEQVAKTFTDVLFRGKKFRVKLLGDSITHGLGGTGFEQNGEPIAEGFCRNPNGYCWAKQFKEYLEAHFPCEVINNACTGTDIQFILRNFACDNDKKLVRYCDKESRSISERETCEIFMERNLYRDEINCKDKPVQIEHDLSVYEREVAENPTGTLCTG